jgi:uncharacterized protein
MSESRPPLPPFTLETALKKVQAAEDAWNSSEWRNRAEFFSGREKIVEFLSRKWANEIGYKLKKELWCFADNRIAVRFEYEWHDDSGNWYRSYGNENWEFAPNGLMQKRFASINDVHIQEHERRLK